MSAFGAMQPTCDVSLEDLVSYLDSSVVAEIEQFIQVIAIVWQCLSAGLRMSSRAYKRTCACQGLGRVLGEHFLHRTPEVRRQIVTGLIVPPYLG